MGQAEFFEKSHHKQEVKVFDLNKKAAVKSIITQLLSIFRATVSGIVIARNNFRL